MIEIKNITKHFGQKCLFDNASFIINKGDKIGVVGLNGSGKTTLFKLILGQEMLDEGEIRIPKGYKIGYLNQFISFSKDTILQEALLSIPKEDEEDFEDKDYLAKSILLGLGFEKESFSMSPHLLSGGFQVRLQLAKLLLTNPDLLLLDEPTNYLDIISIRWLTRFFKSFKGELLLISHDRGFVNSIVSSVVGIHREKILKVSGKIQDYEKVIFEKEDLYEKTRLNNEAKISHMEDFVRRFRAKATKAAAAQSRIKMIEKVERLEKLKEIETLDFSFSYLPHQGKNAISVKNLSFGYEKDKLLIDNLSCEIKSKDKIAIIGKNGKGKTTLLRLIAKELTPIEGEVTINPNIKLGYFGQTNIERLDPSKTIEEEIQSASSDLSSYTKVRNICATMMFQKDDAKKKVSVLSGGEKSRVLLGKILTTPCNVLLLDEPTNHLDLNSTSALIDAAKNFEGVTIIVTHSEEILRTLATKLIVFDNNNCFLFDGTYDEFLERIGWEEEKEETKSTQKSQNNKKEIRKQRAAQLQKEQNLLKPIKEKIKKIEDEIIKKEKLLGEKKEELLMLYEGSFSEKTLETEKDIAFLEKDIENLFLKLEDESKNLETKKQELN